MVEANLGWGEHEKVTQNDRHAREIVGRARELNSKNSI